VSPQGQHPQLATRASNPGAVHCPILFPGCERQGLLKTSINFESSTEHLVIPCHYTPNLSYTFFSNSTNSSFRASVLTFATSHQGQYLLSTFPAPRCRRNPLPTHLHWGVGGCDCATFPTLGYPDPDAECHLPTPVENTSPRSDRCSLCSSPSGSTPITSPKSRTRMLRLTNCLLHQALNAVIVSLPDSSCPIYRSMQ